jgi:hypothetical protein
MAERKASCTSIMTRAVFSGCKIFGCGIDLLRLDIC